MNVINWLKYILRPTSSPVSLPATAVKTNVRALVTGTANERSAIQKTWQDRRTRSSATA